MTGDGNFAEKAKEVEALAALTENPLVRMTLRILAHDYRVLADQENNWPNSGTLYSATGSDSHSIGIGRAHGKRE